MTSTDLNDSLDEKFLRRLAKLCREEKVFKLEACGVRIEMHPSAFDPPVAHMSEVELLKAMADTDKQDICRCGHSLTALHNEAGCLNGCPVSTCIPEET